MKLTRSSRSRLAERVFVGRHPGTAVADTVLHVVVVHRQAGQQHAALVQPGELWGVLGEFVVAEPALVIEDFTPALRPAWRGLAELVGLKRALVVVLGDGFWRCCLRRRLLGDGRRREA